MYDVPKSLIILPYIILKYTDLLFFNSTQLTGVKEIWNSPALYRIPNSIEPTFEFRKLIIKCFEDQYCSVN